MVDKHLDYILSQALQDGKSDAELREIRREHIKNLSKVTGHSVEVIERQRVLQSEFDRGIIAMGELEDDSN